MKISNLLFGLGLFAFNFSYAQIPTLSWAQNVGGSSGCGGTKVRASASDKDGNLYVTGDLACSTFDFDPGAVTKTLPLSGGVDAFFAKYDLQGNLLWVKKIEGPLSERGYAIAVDKNGNVLVGGHIQGTVDFDPSANTANLTSWGDYDIFLAKYDKDGNYLWAFSSGMKGNTSAAEEVLSIVTDEFANVYIGGRSTGAGLSTSTWDIDPGAGIANLYFGKSFVAKYTTDGNFVWVAPLSNVTNSGALAGMALDNFQHIYATTDDGKWYKISTSSGSIIKTNSLSTTIAFINRVVADPSGNVYIGGYFGSKPVSFDGLATINGMDYNDGFVAKYDSTGKYIWHHLYQSYGFQSISDMEIDKNGNYYIVGTLWDVVDFDFSAVTKNVVCAAVDANITNLFAAKYDNNDNLVWVFSLGDGLNSFKNFDNLIDIGINGELYLSGNFQSNTDFDPGVGSKILALHGTDIFMTKFNESGITSVAQLNYNSNEISIYPNPTSENTILKILSEQNANAIISIYDLLGQNVLTENVNLISGQNQISLSTNELSNGVYFVQVNSNSSQSSTSLVIQK